MTLISQSLIDALDNTSSPEDVRAVVAAMRSKINGNIGVGDLDSNTRIKFHKLAHSRSLIFIGQFNINVATGKTFDDIIAEVMIPPNIPPIQLIGGTFHSITSNTGGSVAVYVRDERVATARAITAPVTIEASNTLYSILPYNYTLITNSIIQIRAETGGSATFDPLSGYLLAKARVLPGV